MMKASLLLIALLCVPIVFGTELLVTNFDDRTISFLDTQNPLGGEAIKISANPQRVEISPSGTIGVVTAPNAHSLIIVDIVNREILKVIEKGLSEPLGVSFSPDSSVAYVTNLQGSVFVVDLAALEIVKTLKTGDTPVGIAVSPDGRRLYVANLGDSTIDVFDTKTFEKLEQISSGRLLQSPTTLSFSEDGQLYVIDSRNEQLVRIRSDHMIDPMSISIGGGSMNTELVVGTQYALVSTNVNNRGQVQIIDLDSRLILNAIPFDTTVRSMAFDGSTVFIAKKDGLEQIDVATNVRKDLTAKEGVVGVRIIGAQLMDFSTPSDKKLPVNADPIPITGAATASRSLWKSYILPAVIIVVLLFVLPRLFRGDDVPPPPESSDEPPESPEEPPQPVEAQPPEPPEEPPDPQLPSEEPKKDEPVQ